MRVKPRWHRTVNGADEFMCNRISMAVDMMLPARMLRTFSILATEMSG